TVPAGTATDVAGNASMEASCGYTVVYDWGGFLGPIDTGNVVNVVKAGSAVPVKFSLAGDHGIDILAADSPTIEFGACSPSAPMDAFEQTETAGASGLSYDPETDVYTYVWKTAKSWAGECGTLTVELTDGTTHTALFSFEK
ncbi:MAG TPA: PxKF domain-containing protein, partial [Agromyces sp.]|nr:PxKF domain-containing protein [Agromyces sp.]